MPNFGLLKEQILTNLEKTYGEDKMRFQKGVSRFVKTLKKSHVYSELFRHYKTILESHFDDPEYAKEYLNETVEYLRSLHIGDKDRVLLESLGRTDLSASDIDPNIAALDVLVFSDKKRIKERLEAKQVLQRKLVTESFKKEIDTNLQGVFLELLEKKIKAKWANLNESEMKAIASFANQNEAEILANYIHLVEDNVAAIDEQLNEERDANLRTKLSQTKSALLEMKQETPTLDTLEKLFSLKEIFTK